MKLDKPIGMYIKHKPDIRTFQEEPLLPMSNKYIGIEIEAENIPYTYEDMSKKLYYWDIVNDGSLRNFGAEFITVKLKGRDIILALEELNNFFITHKITPTYTDRTSVHIHVDARYLLFDQLKALILLYLVYEPLFFTKIGKNRDCSNYCIPFYKNTNGLEKLSYLFKASDNEEALLNFVVANSVKYEAMNLKSLNEHGSIEFRHHYGSHDKAELIPWIQALLYMFQQAKMKSTHEIINSLKESSHEEFVAAVNRYLGVPITPELDVRAKYNICSLLAFSTTPLDKRV